MEVAVNDSLKNIAQIRNLLNKYLQVHVVGDIYLEKALQLLEKTEDILVNSLNCST